MTTGDRLQAIESALKTVFDVDFTVGVRKDHVTGYIADATTSAKIEDKYFFSYGRTELSAIKGLAAAIEETLRCRLDKFRTGLNTLLG